MAKKKRIVKPSYATQPLSESVFNLFNFECIVYAICAQKMPMWFAAPLRSHSLGIIPTEAITPGRFRVANRAVELRLTDMPPLKASRLEYDLGEGKEEKGQPRTAPPNSLRLPNLKNSPDQVQALPGGLMPPGFPAHQRGRIDPKFRGHLPLR